jgi:DNA sulfur modification protein DndB
MELSYGYVFPAIRGIQAKCQYYTAMCPIRLIPKLFSFDDEEIPPEMRAQRTLNKVRVPEIANYILNNRDSYVFSAITASINSDIAFEPIGTEGESRNIGSLRVPMDARFIVNDGQHRRAAFELALRENPDLGNETIAVVFFHDLGLKRSQQMFTDLNRYASHPDSSLNILYDHRDKKSILARAVVKEVTIFKGLTDLERSNLPTRSGKLFTLSSVYHATLALLANYKNSELEQQVEIASHYWNEICRHIPHWEQVLQRKVSAGEMRQDYVHCQAITLSALGRMGVVLLSVYPNEWEKRLNGLKKIDWSRSNPIWQERIMVDGRISKSQASVTRMASYLKTQLNLPLTSDEEKLEQSFKLVEANK